MVAWRHPPDLASNVLYVDGHVSLLAPLDPPSLAELKTKTVDSGRTFTWLPGEHNVRFDWLKYDDPGYPGAIEYFNGRYPDFTKTDGKPVIDLPNKQLDFMPPDYPPELSCNYRTYKRIWQKLPARPVDRK